MANDTYRQQFKEGLQQTTGAKLARGMDSLISKGAKLFSDDEKKKKEQEEQRRRAQQSQSLPTQRR
ncbi:hypothetical protein [Helicobacter himalayensis]|uniref:hypothetical protein n=1 Tax=Helicobacter himalayensis TaxID=1591088 RepID=UPI0008377508|nr:hypothetical protein [Helicobacter himalayensis]